jgi:hypothetical protein
VRLLYGINVCHRKCYHAVVVPSLLVFCVVTSCGLGHQRFAGKYSLRLQGVTTENKTTYSPQWKPQNSSRSSCKVNVTPSSHINKTAIVQLRWTGRQQKTNQCLKSIDLWRVADTFSVVWKCSLKWKGTQEPTGLASHELKSKNCNLLKCVGSYGSFYPSNREQTSTDGNDGSIYRTANTPTVNKSSANMEKVGQRFNWIVIYIGLNAKVFAVVSFIFVLSWSYQQPASFYGTRWSISVPEIGSHRHTLF